MISALVSFVLRAVLAVATVVLVLALLAMALATTLGLLLWSLIRGRRPQVDFAARFARARQFRAGGAGFGPRGGRAMGEVVDVEVREVREGRELQPGTPRLE